MDAGSCADGAKYKMVGNMLPFKNATLKEYYTACVQPTTLYPSDTEAVLSFVSKNTVALAQEPVS